MLIELKMQYDHTKRTVYLYNITNIIISNIYIYPNNIYIHNVDIFLPREK